MKTKIRELFQLAWDVLLFRHAAYAQHVARADALKRGLALLTVVTLFAGLLPLFVDVVGDLRRAGMSVEARQEEVEQTLGEFLDSWRAMSQFSNIPPEVERMVLANVRIWTRVGLRIDALPTPLPKPVGRLLQDVGAFLSLPFGRMAAWIGYTMWVLLIAKFLGGRATVSQMLGTTALYAVPHVLGVVSVVPCLGGVAGLVATVWGVAIYVKAVAVANRFSLGRATAATVLPAMLGAVAALGGLLMTVMVAVLGG